jgi:hypothetical protein
MGKLTFADARSTDNLAAFYNFSMTPRTFETVPAPEFAFDRHPERLKLEAPDDD